MLCRVLLFLALIIGGFFAFRYFSLLYAMKKNRGGNPGDTAGPYSESDAASAGSKPCLRKTFEFF